MIAGTVYCIDTSAFLAGHKRVYPHHVFVGLWNKMDELVQQARLIAPEEVFKELEDQDDDLTKWIKERKQMFIKPDYHQSAVVSQIARDFPQLSKSKISSNAADPWVIALAKVRGCLVVSEERRESEQNPKIPQICRHFYVSHVPFLNIVLAEWWVFP